VKSLTIFSILVLIASVSAISAIPSSYAQSTATVSAPAGTSVPGCEETNACFIPDNVTVDVGGTVTWSNDDTAAHTVTSGDLSVDPDNVGSNFDSSLWMAGTTFEVTFDTAGEFPYFCQVHPWMAGTVTVQEAMAEEVMAEPEVMMEEEVMEEETMMEEEMMEEEVMEEEVMEEEVMEEETMMEEEDQVPAGMERATSMTDPGIGHESHQIAILLAPSENVYSGTLTYAASEPIQVITLHGPLAEGEDMGQPIWTPDGDTKFALTFVDQGSAEGEWIFAGNALAVHTMNMDEFTVDYDIDYTEKEMSDTVITGTLESVQDPAVDHESHQLTVILPPSENTYSGILSYAASEPIQLVTLHGPLAEGETADATWTLAGEEGDTVFELNFVNPENSMGSWAFSGNALAVHTMNMETMTTSFSVSAIETEASAGGGGCLIATAAYGSEMAPQVQFLREIRDNTLLSTESGTAFMAGFNSIYYSFSPAVADLERDNAVFKEAVKLFITPMISTLSIMELADGSESSVLALGMSVIALNLGMYIAAPAAVGFAVHKKIKSRN